MNLQLQVLYVYNLRNFSASVGGVGRFQRTSLKLLVYWLQTIGDTGESIWQHHASVVLILKLGKIRTTKA